MKKVIRLTESDLNRIVKKIIKENEEESDWWTKFGFDSEESFVSDYEEADDYASELISDVDYEIQELLIRFFETVDLGRIIKKRQLMFEERYPQYVNPDEEFYNEGIDYLMNANLNPDSEELMELLFKGYDHLLDYIFYEKR